MTQRILYLIPTLEKIGGAESQLTSMAIGMQRRGWLVDVLTLSGGSPAVHQRLSSLRIHTDSLLMRGGLRDLRGWWRLRQWIGQHRPSIVHAHLPHASWMARWIRLIAPVPIQIDTLHSTSTGGIGREIGYQISRSLPNLVTAVSQPVLESHVKRSMIKRENTHVIANGVDTSYWKPNTSVREEFRHRHGLDGVFLWFASGRIEDVKDYPTMLTALAHLPCSAHLAIAGSGSRLAHLRAIAHQFGIEQRVHLLGFVEDTRCWMQASDAYLQSSLWEGLPIALLEASACALPSVTSDLSCNRIACGGQDEAFFVTIKDSRGFSTAMQRLMLLSQAERDYIGQAARQHIIANFDLPVILDQWESIYTQLLNKCTHQRPSLANL